MLSLWLAVCMAEPVQLHTCAMHGGLAIVSNATAATHIPSAGHHAVRAGTGHDHHEQGTDSESRQCSCLGDCNAGSSPVGVASPAISLVTAPITEAAANSFTHPSPRIVAPRFLLPFSNGPPAGSSRV